MTFQSILHLINRRPKEPMDYPNAVIEEIMQDFQETIGADFEKYRNHVYRVFFNCILQDGAPEHVEKYAIAAVFHDIGIWTDDTIDYLHPSIQEMRHYLAARGRTALADEIASMIYWHHKVSRYQGKFELPTEIFRRADWIDVTLGLIRFGLDFSMLIHYRKMLPNKGFHALLIKKLFFNLFRHPLKPLPMFTK